jgi:release factor glutamine methyltransferase
VLDPRPETEGLVAAALTLPFHDVLDLGTGSGAILLSLLADCPSARGLGVDISLKALDVARENAKVLQIELKRSAFLYSNWFENVTGNFDLIVANPPYITQEEMRSLDLGVLTYEPHLALSPGGDGLDPFLRPLGRIIVEIGPCQAANVCSLFKSQGLNGVKVHQDFDGRDRLVEAYKHA